MMDKIIQDLETYKKVFDKAIRVQTAFFNYYSVKKLLENMHPDATDADKENFGKRVLDYRISHEKEAFELNLMLTRLPDSGIPSGSILHNDFDEPFFKIIRKMFEESEGENYD